MGLLLRVALRRALDQVRHVDPVRPRQARDLVGAVYRQLERDFGGLAPPIALHSPAPRTLAASWLMLRETLVADGAVDRATREAVAASVSAGNTCPYCVEVHTATLSALGGSSFDPVTEWAPEQAPEIIGVAVAFHYLNRMVNVFLGGSPLPPGLPAGARERARRVLGRFMRSAARPTFPPGASLELLDEAPLPADLSWAAGNPAVAGAFARAAAAVDAAGRRALPDAVRELVSSHVSAWDGTGPGPSRAWVDPLLEGLAAADRPAARLALLTAIASYQVDTAVVDAVGADDRTLVELTSWASLTAARRVGSRLAGERSQGRR